MKITEFIPWAGGVVAFLLSLIEIPKIKLNVWEWLALKIGNAFSRTVIDDLKSLKREIAETKVTAEEVKQDLRRNVADQCRRRILDFNDTLIHGEKHTKEHFNDILIDIDVYEDYCEIDEDYKNTRAELAIENIKEEYKRCQREGDFL